MKIYKTDSCLARAMWWALFYGFCVLYSCDNPWSWYKWCAGYFYISLAQLGLFWRGNLNWKIAPPVGPVVEPVVLFLDWWWMGEGPAHCWYGHPWAVVLGPIRKQAWQVMRSKSVDSASLWSLHQLLSPGSCPKFLSQRQCLGCGRWNRPFPPQVAMITMFHHSSRSPDKEAGWI